MRFADRQSAGQGLAREIAKLGLDTPIIFALPRGGVPVGREIARALGAPLDLLLVRKIGVPWQRELAAASIVDGERPDLVLNEDVMAAAGLTRADIDQEAKPALAEIERRRALYLKDRPPCEARDRDVVIVDDGIATGASIRAAIKAVRRRNARRIVLAAPVAAADTIEEMRALVDDVVCLYAPRSMMAIGMHYDDFHQLTDDEVIEALDTLAKPARDKPISGPPGGSPAASSAGSPSRPTGGPKRTG